MNKQIKYIELKSGFGDGGPAWISEVRFSKSGNTIYFNDSALKKMKNPGIGSNHFDIETGEEYWISGFKKNGQDRHWAGGGKVLIDEDIIEDYLNEVDFSILDKKYFEIIELVKDFKLSRFNDLENREKKEQIFVHYSQWYWDNNRKKLILE